MKQRQRVSVNTSQKSSGSSLQNVKEVHHQFVFICNMGCVVYMIYYTLYESNWCVPSEPPFANMEYM